MRSPVLGSMPKRTQILWRMASARKANVVSKKVYRREDPETGKVQFPKAQVPDVLRHDGLSAFGDGQLDKMIVPLVRRFGLHPDEDAMIPLPSGSLAGFGAQP